MHRDKRLGLALGILLLGIVAALFFRNKANQEPVPPDLVDAAKIDEEIAEQEFVPYLTGLEEVPAAEPTAQKDGEPGPPAEERPSGPWEISDLLREETVDPSLPSANGPPDPIDTSVTEKAGLPIPAENDAWEVVKAEAPVSIKRPQALAVSSRAVGASLIHKVRKGDTLSGLAERYLGSRAQFMDIYNANQDLLKNPNDLRVGLPLRIPQKGRADSRDVSGDGRIPAIPISVRDIRPDESSDSPAVETPKKSAPEEPSVRRFLPVRRPPLSPSRR